MARTSPPLEGNFQPATTLVSWDSTEYSTRQFCGNDTYDFVNAVYCWDDNNIGWDRGQLLPLLRKTFGDISIPLVLGHEYGHAVQRRAQLAGTATPSLVAEQQADCFAGVYMRWVAEGKSPRFTMSTGDGLNSVLATVISLRDPVRPEANPTATNTAPLSSGSRRSSSVSPTAPPRALPSTRTR